MRSMVQRRGCSPTQLSESGSGRQQCCNVFRPDARLSRAGLFPSRKSSACVTIPPACPGPQQTAPLQDYNICFYNIPMSDYNTGHNTILQWQHDISMTTTLHFNYNNVVIDNCFMTGQCCNWQLYNVVIDQHYVLHNVVIDQHCVVIDNCIML